MNRPTEPLGIQINSRRLMDRIETLARINRLEDGSCCRIALTDADRAAREQVMCWMAEAKLKIHVDRIGNIVGVRPGNHESPPVMTGSHIDTVSTGGAYDGVLGVMAGLEAMQILEESGLRSERPLALAIFTNEEGVRFQPDMMGSLVFANGLSLEEALATTASDGTTVGEELQRTGFSGSEPCGVPRPHAFVELHIEQGPILDREGIVLGAVTDLQGIHWREVTIRGMSNHAGTTPMSMRRDAGYSAARISVFVRELTQELGETQVGTVGSVHLIPNLVNVIAGQATVSIDIRNTRQEQLSQAEHALDQFLEELAQREGVEISSRNLVRTPPVVFDDEIVRTIEEAAADLGWSVRRITSGAGHDAQMISRLCPSGMIFVPSRDGVSHSPHEFTEPEHLTVGANVLLQTLWRMAASHDGS